MPRVDGFKSYEDWAMWAKANGYPLCRDCREPISKAYQAAGSKLCSSCSGHSRRLIEKGNSVRAAANQRRKSSVTRYEI